MVEDREYTHGLIEIGLKQIESGYSISEERMDAWMDSWSNGEDLPFPKAELASNQ